MYVKVVNNFFVFRENKDLVAPFSGIFWNMLLGVMVAIVWNNLLIHTKVFIFGSMLHLLLQMLKKGSDFEHSVKIFIISNWLK